tara:strand:+ start:45 stop:533 length:489 start_codon:yes stop_codon:yes gene_type:complete
MDEVVKNIEGCYAKNYKAFIKQAHGIIKDHHDAEEIVQETFVRALRFKHSFNEDGDMTKWIKTILFRCAMNHLNENKMQGMSRGVEEEDIFTDSDADYKGLLSSEVSKMVERISDPKKKQVCYNYFIIGNPLRHVAKCSGLGYNNTAYIVKAFKTDLKKVYS